MFVKDAEIVVFKLLQPLEYISQKWYHTAWYPTVNNIMQDYNEAVNYDENASQSSMWRSYHQSCVRDTYKYLRYYVEKEWVTTWDVYVGSNNIEGNNVSIWYDEWYTHHRTYTDNWKLDNVIYKLRDEEWTVEDALKKHRKKNEEAIWYEMKEIDADFIREHLDPKLYIDEKKGIRYWEPMNLEPDDADKQESELAEKDLADEQINNWQVIVTPNDDWTVTVPAGTETWYSLHYQYCVGLHSNIVANFRPKQSNLFQHCQIL